jgi:hypothetical protein
MDPQNYLADEVSSFGECSEPKRQTNKGGK